MKDLVIVSNRGPIAFSEAFLQQAEAALNSGNAPESPGFGEGGLVQAMAGLLKTERWNPIWMGASMGDRDIDVAIGNYSGLFRKMDESGYTPDTFPHIEIDPERRIRFIYKGYEFYTRLVFFDTEHMHSYYSKFANGFLWPLMHLTRGPLFYKSREKIYPRPFFEKNDFLQYTSSGVTFAHTIFDETKKSTSLWKQDDEFIVWTQDYHLMQVAESYKALLAAERFPEEKRKKIHLGHFMHTPFFDIHEIQSLLRDDKRSRIRSQRFDPFAESIESVLQKLTWGMLANDFIGFHHKVYCDNYLEALQEWFPRYHVDIRQTEQFYEIAHPNGITTVGVFPIGLDVHKILAELSKENPLQYQKDNLYESMQEDRKRGRYIFGGLERCDYTKGLLARLGIFSRTLSKLTKWTDGKTEARLYQITAPSRFDNPAYRNLTDVIREEIVHSNSKLKRDYEPIVHIKEGLPPPQNYGFMQEVDVMLVTPLEDGMNLVAFEYILSQKQRKERGMLVLGNCGAARELKNTGFGAEDGIIYVDPLEEENAAEKVTSALRQGRCLSEKVVNYIERECRVDDWAQKNIDAIVNCRKTP